MRRKLIVLGALLTLSLCATAQARFVQGTSLTATSSVQRWESKTLPGKLPTEVHIYRHGEEVPQRWINNCSANYVSGSLIVRVQITHDCGKPVPGTYTLRYVSVTRKQRFRVELTR